MQHSGHDDVVQSPDTHQHRARRCPPAVSHSIKSLLTPAPRSTTRLASMTSCFVMRYWPGGTDTVTPLLLAAARAEASAIAAWNVSVSSAEWVYKDHYGLED